MQTTSEGLQKERDFYFEKLRQVEVLAQETIETARAQQTGAGDAQFDETQVPIAARHVLDILYATEVRSIEFFAFQEPDPLTEPQTSDCYTIPT